MKYALLLSSSKSSAIVNEGNYAIKESILSNCLNKAPIKKFTDSFSESLDLPTSLNIETFNLGGATDKAHLHQRMKQTHFTADVVCLQEFNREFLPNIPKGYWQSKIPEESNCGVFPVILSRFPPQSVE